MRKNVKKPHRLNLPTETLRCLSSMALETVAGGMLSGDRCPTAATRWPETNCCDSYVMMC